MRDRIWLSAPLLLCGSVGWGCIGDGAGFTPPPFTLRSPVALQLSRPTQKGQSTAEPTSSDRPRRIGSRFLYVANSNFDLKYSSGSVQSFDLDRLHACVTELKTHGTDPRCRTRSGNIIEPSSVGQREVLIDAFASAMKLNQAGDRLYVTTRSREGALLYLKLDPKTEQIAVEGCQVPTGRCGSALRVPLVDDEGQPVPEPMDVTLGGADLVEKWPEVILVGHRFGQVSLLHTCTSGDCDAPVLEGTYRNIAGRLSSIEFEQEAEVAMVTERGGTSLQRLGISKRPNEQGDPGLALFNAGRLLLVGVHAQESRAIAFMPSNQALIAAAAPNSLMLADLTPERIADGVVRPHGLVPIGSAPSRVVVGSVGGDSRQFAFVSCFDARELYIIDVELQRVVSVVQGFNGPFEMVLDDDPGRPYLYVADFRSSVIRVVDVKPLSDRGPGSNVQIVASIGAPQGA